MQKMILKKMNEALEANALKIVKTDQEKHAYDFVLILPNRLNPENSTNIVKPWKNYNRGVSKKNYTNVSDTEMVTYVDYIMDQIQSHTLCKGIHMSHIEYKLNHSDIILLFRKSSEPIELHGIAICVKDPDHFTLKVDIVCGSNTQKGIGSILLEEIRQIAKALGYKAITLQSLPSSIGFYFKKGFSCNNPEKLCNMKYELHSG